MKNCSQEFNSTSRSPRVSLDDSGFFLRFYVFALLLLLHYFLITMCIYNAELTGLNLLETERSNLGKPQ